MEGNAPYSTERAHNWFQLTGFDGTSQEPPGARYASLMAFLDEFCDELADRRGIETSRLEAQGLAWSITESAPPDAWSKEERAALETWRAGGSEPPRAWLVRPKHATVADWLVEGHVALAASHLAKVPAGADLKTVTKAVESGYQHIDYAQRQALAVEYHAFLSRMRPGDVVMTHAQERVHAGRITGDPKYVSGVEDRLRRAVDWESSVARSDVATGLADVLELQGTVVDLTDSFDDVVDLLESGGPVDQPKPDDWIDPQPPSDDGPKELALPPVTLELAESLHTDVAPLQEIVDLLASASRWSSTGHQERARPTSLWPWPSTSSERRTPAIASSCSSTPPTPTRTSSRGSDRTRPRRAAVVPDHIRTASSHGLRGGPEGERRTSRSC